MLAKTLQQEKEASESNVSSELRSIEYPEDNGSIPDEQPDDFQKL